MSPHGGGGGGGAPKWCLKMFLVQRDNERTMARPVLQSGISSYREHLALQAHRESEKLLSLCVRGNEPPLPCGIIASSPCFFYLTSSGSKENKYAIIR